MLGVLKTIIRSASEKGSLVTTEHCGCEVPSNLEALVRKQRQMNLLGNGDGTIAKLGETLTRVSINKPLIRKKEAERCRSNSTGGEYQWHPHICMQAQLSGEGPGVTGASPMVSAHPSIHDPPRRGEHAYSLTVH